MGGLSYWGKLIDAFYVIYSYAPNSGRISHFHPSSSAILNSVSSSSVQQFNCPVLFPNANTLQLKPIVINHTIELFPQYINSMFSSVFFYLTAQKGTPHTAFVTLRIRPGPIRGAPFPTTRQ